MDVRPTAKSTKSLSRENLPLYGIIRGMSSMVNNIMYINVSRFLNSKYIHIINNKIHPYS